jgi:hypothetical protein
VESLSLGHIVARVYNAAEAAMRGYNPLTYNPVLRTASSAKGGRFDATPMDPYGYLYVGMGVRPAVTALWEVVFNKAEPVAGTISLAEAEVEDLAIQYFVPNHHCQLLCLRNARECKAVGAAPELTSGPDYALSREWARYLRQVIRGVHGIQYRSHGTGGDGFNVVLFSDQCIALPLEPLGDAHSYSENDGRRMIRTLAAEEGIAILP